MSAVLDQVRALLGSLLLPAGLLPASVTHLDYDPASGAFVVELPAPVVRVFAGHKVRYDARISGRALTGRIDELAGVAAKVGLWFNVTVIETEGAQLVFSVGRVRKRLPAAVFD